MKFCKFIYHAAMFRWICSLASVCLYVCLLILLTDCTWVHCKVCLEQGLKSKMIHLTFLWHLIDIISWSIEDWNNFNSTEGQAFDNWTECLLSLLSFALQILFHFHLLYLYLRITFHWLTSQVGWHTTTDSKLEVLFYIYSMFVHVVKKNGMQHFHKQRWLERRQRGMIL